ncbi:MAG: CRISPR-associated protein Csx3 [Candidatus Omnitrophica bacterium]|nr:CRISPR-associated protein Csx3 [Candidatus Omnitrophota bacterium]
MVLDLSTFYALTGTAKLVGMSAYEGHLEALVPPGADVTLTGPAHVWLYLRITHSLHEFVHILTYNRPVTGLVEIFNHNPHATVQVGLWGRPPVCRFPEPPAPSPSPRSACRASWNCQVGDLTHT